MSAAEHGTRTAGWSDGKLVCHFHALSYYQVPVRNEKSLNKAEILDE